MLTLTSVEASYGRVKALRGVSLHVDPGEIVTLIGANGAGKSTILKTISGIVQAEAGSIKLNGQEISGWSAGRIVGAGLC